MATHQRVQAPFPGSLGEVRAELERLGQVHFILNNGPGDSSLDLVSCDLDTFLLRQGSQHPLAEHLLRIGCQDFCKQFAAVALHLAKQRPQDVASGDLRHVSLAGTFNRVLEDLLGRSGEGHLLRLPALAEAHHLLELPAGLIQAHPERLQRLTSATALCQKAHYHHLRAHVVLLDPCRLRLSEDHCLDRLLGEALKQHGSPGHQRPGARRR
mmetsp:Transcript_20292/g.47355  ORF Transcript_20292/g.47355 Transcript_20292/m.47355 type:complete len:212 (+) Transcript_20292:1244-1879(+)